MEKLNFAKFLKLAIVSSFTFLYKGFLSKDQETAGHNPTIWFFGFWLGGRHRMILLLPNSDIFFYLLLLFYFLFFIFSDFVDLYIAGDNTWERGR